LALVSPACRPGHPIEKALDHPGVEAIGDLTVLPVSSDDPDLLLPSLRELVHGHLGREHLDPDTLDRQTFVLFSWISRGPEAHPDL